jgi:hypothetical protein
MIQTIYIQIMSDQHDCIFYFLNKKLLQTLRRLAQNREAARKSRLRKKVGPFVSSILFPS